MDKKEKILEHLKDFLKNKEVHLMIYYNGYKDTFISAIYPASVDHFNGMAYAYGYGSDIDTSIYNLSNRLYDGVTSVKNNDTL